eukprot:EG_transcript_6459
MAAANDPPAPPKKRGKSFLPFRRSPRLRDVPEPPPPPQYIAPPCGPEPLYTVADQDMFAHWEGRWYPITILRDSTRQEGSQWMYDVQWEGYTGPEGDAAQNNSSYPEAWIWHRSFVPPSEMVPWARSTSAAKPRAQPTAAPPPKRRTPLRRRPRSASRARAGPTKAGAAKAALPEDAPKLPKWEDDEYQPEAALPRKRPKRAVPVPPENGSNGLPAAVHLVRRLRQAPRSARTPTPATRPRTRASKSSPAEPPRVTAEAAGPAAAAGADSAAVADVADDAAVAAPAPRRFIGPECGPRPAYRPGRRQELMALWRHVWYPVVVLQESTEKVDGQWIYNVRWLQNPQAPGAGAGAEREESDYPEGWIWERRHVPPRQMVPWARNPALTRQALAAALAELRRAKKRGFGDEPLAEVPPVPEPPTARERALAENKCDWQPVVHPSQLSVGMDVRLMAQPVSGYTYQVVECLGQRGKVQDIRGYPPVQVKFETGVSYWCDYQDLEFFGARDW